MRMSLLFFSVPWLPYSQLWTNVEREVSLTQCHSLHFIILFTAKELPEHCWVYRVWPRTEWDLNRQLSDIHKTLLPIWCHGCLFITWENTRMPLIFWCFLGGTDKNRWHKMDHSTNNYPKSSFFEKLFFSINDF